jgi:hypothetical protein
VHKNNSIFLEKRSTNQVRYIDLKIWQIFVTSWDFTQREREREREIDRERETDRQREVQVSTHHKSLWKIWGVRNFSRFKHFDLFLIVSEKGLGNDCILDPNSIPRKRVNRFLSFFLQNRCIFLLTASHCISHRTLFPESTQWNWILRIWTTGKIFSAHTIR